MFTKRIDKRGIGMVKPRQRRGRLGNLPARCSNQQNRLDDVRQRFMGHIPAVNNVCVSA